ncbi:MAG: T9SS C-terminal target domain-containing protein, partial [Spirosoma sp.]|nr:T9SS C-terminal target domain-containing protein [Spirosoma sp.]
EIEPTMAAGPYTLRMYIDNPTIRLRATQTGTPTDAVFVYDWLAACGTGTTMSKVAKESRDETSLSVRVLGNPIVNGRVHVEVAGAAGQPVQFMLTDMRGTVINTHRVEQPALVETHVIDVGRQPVGTLLLRVSTSTQSKTVTLLKKE